MSKVGAGVVGLNVGLEVNIGLEVGWLVAPTPIGLKVGDVVGE